MRNEQGESRGFGFVSFQTPEQATAAMHAMNGAQLGSKQIVVRLHEPKQLRQEKLAQRYGHNGHPRSASGATSPTPSEMGDWGSPRVQHASLGSPKPNKTFERPERPRRGSGSYYQVSDSVRFLLDRADWYSGCCLRLVEHPYEVRRALSFDASGQERGHHR